MDLVSIINNSNCVLIVGHIKPDGDCFGSGLSLLRVCEAVGKKAFFVCDSELSYVYSFMPGYEKTNIFEPLDFDLLISVDCGDHLRLGRYKEYLKKVKTTVNIDHHISNNGFAKINYIQPEASSTCELVYELLENSGLIDPTIAQLLFVGLSTDTGHFMHNTTSKNVLKIAARLTDLGADPFYIADKLYKNRTIAKTMLIARAIASLRFYHDNEIAIMSITKKDFEETGCQLSDTEGLIDYASSISTVKVCACLAEQKEKTYKIGFRSKGVNVANIAGTFGGGGHVRAAGCMIGGYYEDVVSKLERAITYELDLYQEQK